MGRKVPTGQASIEVPGLGQVQGRLYSNDVRQYYGIPYGRLSKRWTRASMVTSWDGGFHNGTKLGFVASHPSNCCCRFQESHIPDQETLPFSTRV